MTSLGKQVATCESVRLRFLTGRATVREVREALQSAEDVRSQCDLLADLVFSLTSDNQKLRSELSKLQSDLAAEKQNSYGDGYKEGFRDGHQAREGGS